MEAAKEPRMDLATVIREVRGKWRLIAALGAAGCVIGGGLAFTLPPVYSSKAVIALKSAQGADPTNQLLGRLGGLGGSVATQLVGTGGNLEHAQIVLQSRDLAERVVKDSLGIRRILASSWDAESGRWKGGSTPALWRAADHLRSRMLEVKANRNTQTISISLEASDPALAKRLAEDYLVELNNTLRFKVVQDADSNRAFLERNMYQTTDPILREKISALIANEMEKGLLLRTSVIDVLENPYEAEFPTRPNKKLMLVTSLLVGMAAGLCLAAGQAMWRNLGRVA